MTDAIQALTYIQALQEQLSYRRRQADEHYAYYRGKHKLHYASDKFREYFSNRYSKFADNWVQVIAESPTERLAFQGLRLDGDERAADKDFSRIWTMNGMDADSGLAFLDSIIASRSYGFVWGNPDDEETPEQCFEDSREAIVGYVPGSRRKRAAGLKLWADDKTEYATLYLPDSVWKFRRPVYRQVVKLEVPQGIDSFGGWVPREPEETGDDTWPMPNPMGEVPLVELPNRPLLAEEPLSDVTGVIAMQNAVNLLWAHLFTASDFAALPQRLVLGADAPKIPVLDENAVQVGERVMSLDTLHEKRVLFIPDPDAKIAEWSPANLAVYSDAIESAVGHMAAQTRTPQHYLIGKMANMSADALKAAETGLVKKTEEKQLYFGEAIREMHRLTALAQGNEAKAKAARSGTPVWKDAEMRSEAQLVDSLQKLEAVGFPFQWIAERYGLSATEIDRIMDMKKEEQANQPVPPPQIVPNPLDPAQPAPVEPIPAA